MWCNALGSGNNFPFSERRRPKQKEQTKAALAHKPHTNHHTQTTIGTPFTAQTDIWCRWVLEVQLSVFASFLFFFFFFRFVFFFFLLFLFSVFPLRAVVLFLGGAVFSFSSPLFSFVFHFFLPTFLFSNSHVRRARLGLSRDYGRRTLRWHALAVRAAAQGH